MSQQVSNEQAVEEQLRTFIDAVTESETYAEFVAANDRLEEDAEAMALLQDTNETISEQTGVKYGQACGAGGSC